MSEHVKSPCISVCVLNKDDICEGCYRSAEEITRWAALDNTQKKAVMKNVKARLERLNKYRLL